MPLYDYKCTSCAHVTEIRHGFDENHERTCPACGAPMARVFSAAPILFKGSGFYVTDSRKDGAGGSSTDAASAEPKAEPKKAEPEKPAPTKPEPKSSDSKRGERKGKESAA
jgi:putative FmdB family regulatory protein